VVDGQAQIQSIQSGVVGSVLNRQRGPPASRQGHCYFMDRTTNERSASFSTNGSECWKTENSHERFISCQKSRIVVPCKPSGRLSLTRGTLSGHSSQLLRNNRFQSTRDTRVVEKRCCRRPNQSSWLLTLCFWRIRYGRSIPHIKPYCSR
jgi:hypothetical protein